MKQESIDDTRMPHGTHPPMIRQPISLYDCWAAYDELTDKVELTEELVMRQFGELLRLRRLGVRFDYFMMDAFWYARDGGYRTWRRPHWPHGPDRWLAACREHGIQPGLWVAVNCIRVPGFDLDLKIGTAPEWRDSLTAHGGTLCMFEGGFLSHFFESLHLWYERGARMFKFDFIDFSAATPALQRSMTPAEIRTANERALYDGLRTFRVAHPGVVLTAYNGLEEAPTIENTSLPFRRSVSTKWLDVFDSLYCGDARPADVPAMNFWRSKDVYSDHMVRVYELNEVPLSRIDNVGFMIGALGTCYGRGTAAWRGMLLLSLARGGWVNTYYGDLAMLDESKARWFAKIQAMFLPLQARGLCRTFGGVPGRSRPYGYSLVDEGNGLVAVVNPTQGIVTVDLPATGRMRLLFRDAGFEPALSDVAITLGAEQLALVGVGSFADAAFDLGVQEDVIIPRSVRQLETTFTNDGEKAIAATVMPVEDGWLRITLRQCDADGIAVRSTGGAPPNGVKLGDILRLEVSQDGRAVPVCINYDKPIWSGLSWAVGEVDCRSLEADCPLMIRCSTTEPKDVVLHGELYGVTTETVSLVTPFAELHELKPGR